MNIVLNQELEQLIQSELDTGKYENVEAVPREALRLLSERNSRRIVARKVNDLFDKTQALPGLKKLQRRKLQRKLQLTGEAILNPVASELILPKIRRRQCRFPTAINCRDTALPSPLYHSGAAGIDRRWRLK